MQQIDSPSIAPEPKLPWYRNTAACFWDPSAKEWRSMPIPYDVAVFEMDQDALTPYQKALVAARALELASAETETAFQRLARALRACIPSNR